MIEILEQKDSTSKKQSEMPDNPLRKFIFRNGNKTLGIIQFRLMHPHIASLERMETTESTDFTKDVIADGLIRTACHTFQNENIPWITAHEEILQELHVLTSFFTHSEKIREVSEDEKMTAILNDHHQKYVLKTDMIYKGGCKGV